MPTAKAGDAVWEGWNLVVPVRVTEGTESRIVRVSFPDAELEGCTARDRESSFVSAAKRAARPLVESRAYPAPPPLTKDEAERILAHLRPGFAAIAERDGKDYVITLMPLASVEPPTVNVDDVPNGRSQIGYRESLRALLRRA